MSIQRARETVELAPLVQIENSKLENVSLEVRELIRAEKSENTRRAYRCDNEIFSAWCSRRGIRAYPLAPGLLASFLADQAKEGLKAMTLTRRVAAIRHAHRALELPDPFDQTARSTLAGIRNKLGVRVEPHAPLLAADLLKIILAIPFDGEDT
jgi:hypothetical protein